MDAFKLPHDSGPQVGYIGICASLGLITLVLAFGEKQSPPKLEILERNGDTTKLLFDSEQLSNSWKRVAKQAVTSFSTNKVGERLVITDGKLYETNVTVQRHSQNDGAGCGSFSYEKKEFVRAPFGLSQWTGESGAVKLCL